jgi:HD-GYP domain-containing protein (c-di-GMP phosphodiesterase class II)
LLPGEKGNRAAALNLGSVLASFSRALESRDPSMRGHGARVAANALTIARGLGWNEARLVALQVAGVLHDVGKLSVATEILRKPGGLTSSELAEVRRHPAAGARMIEPFPALRSVIPYVLYHHERWDGEGYPAARSGDAIPLGARILAVADAFDAMTSPRPYRESLTPEAALAEVERCAGTQFDPLVAQTFLECWRENGYARAAGL